MTTGLSAFLLGLILACSGTAQAQEDVSPDAATQKVLAHYGLDSKILRSYAQLRESSPRRDGRFLLSFEGAPGIEVLLDRNYWVLVAWSAKKENDTLAYLLNPEDGQSGLNISVGQDIRDKADADLKKSPGTSSASKVTPHAGQVGGQSVTWRRWSDPEHLHIECALDLPVGEQANQLTRKVEVTVTANTTARRKALEDAMASLKLLPARR